MTEPFESFISNGLFSIVGDPGILGILIIAFFSGFVFIAPTHPSFKALIIGGAVILASPFLPGAAIFFGIIGGLIIWFAGSRMFSR